MAHWLLLRALRDDRDLQTEVERSDGIESFLDFLFDNRVHIDVRHNLSIRESAQFVRLELAVAEQDVEGLIRVLKQEPSLLTARHLSLQNHLIETCAFSSGAKLVRALLDLGPAIQRQPPADSRALVYAIDYGDREMIELLIPHWQPRDELPTWAGLGRLDRVRSFFDQEGKIGPHRAYVYPQSSEVEDQKTILVHALGLACMNEQLETADFLIRHGADLNAPWGLHEPATILHEVAANGRLEAVRFLLERGADVTSRDERFGATALGWARYADHRGEQDLLLEPTIRADFFSAVQFGPLEEIERHLRKGQDVNGTLDFVRTQGVPALFLAVSQDRPEVVEFLLARGADAGARDSRQRGALHWLQSSAKHGERMAEALIGQGIDVNAPDREGVTPRDHARAQDLREVEKLLSRGWA